MYEIYTLVLPKFMIQILEFWKIKNIQEAYALQNFQNRFSFVLLQ